MSNEPPVLVSEKLEPAFAHFIGVRHARYRYYKDKGDLGKAEDELHSWWYGMRAMFSFSSSLGGTGCVHFNVSSGNEYRRVAQFIETQIGYDPLMDHPEDHPKRWLFTERGVS